MTGPEMEKATAFLEGLEKTALVSLLVELAEDNEFVRERMERLLDSGDPRKLVARFRRSLTGWRRGSRLITYGESGAFAAELERWLQQVKRELMPLDAKLALDLYETFIESDGALLNRADDSNGSIGDAFGFACQCWLQAAARCPPGKDDWVERIYKLAKADDYGVREDLLGAANLLLNEEALRQLASRFESELQAAVHRSKNSAHLVPEVFSAAGALQLVGRALRDPEVSVRATLVYSPDPNPLQRAGFVKGYLQFGPAQKALAWLDGDWGHHEGSRMHLLAETYRALARREDEAKVREQIFSRSGRVDDFRNWQGAVDAASRPRTVEAARARASAHADPIEAAALLLEIGDDASAEALILKEAAQINGNDYPRLVPLAHATESRKLLLGCTVCYRALLNGILSRGYAKAYSHGARYLEKLREIAPNLVGPLPFDSPQVYEAQLLSAHKRKVSFWKHVSDAGAQADSE